MIGVKTDYIFDIYICCFDDGRHCEWLVISYNLRTLGWNDIFDLLLPMAVA